MCLRIPESPVTTILASLNRIAQCWKKQVSSFVHSTNSHWGPPVCQAPDILTHSVIMTTPVSSLTVQAERYTNLPTDSQLASGSIKMKTIHLVNHSSHLVNVVTIHLGTLARIFRISPFLLSLITTTKLASSPQWLLFLIPLHSHILALAQVQIGFFFFLLVLYWGEVHTKSN